MFESLIVVLLFQLSIKILNLITFQYFGKGLSTVKTCQNLQKVDMSSTWYFKWRAPDAFWLLLNDFKCVLRFDDFFILLLNYVTIMLHVTPSQNCRKKKEKKPSPVDNTIRIFSSIISFLSINKRRLPPQVVPSSRPLNSAVVGLSQWCNWAGAPDLGGMKEHTTSTLHYLIPNSPGHR